MGSFELDLTNFQSIGKANLEFEPGINLIVGQSNSGKTAILRAIKAVVTNPSRAKFYIKKGTDEAVVSIANEGNELMWSRSAKGGSKYNVNGEEYSKLGTSNLFNILEDNGFVQDDSGNVMNIEGEWDLAFPFDRTPSELFRLFENIFCVSDSAVILKSFKEEEADSVKQRTVLEERHSRLGEKVKALEDLKAEVDLEKIEGEVKSFEQDYKIYSTMKADCKELEFNKRISEITVDDVLPPEHFTLQELEQAYQDSKYLTHVLGEIKFYKSLPEEIDVPQTLTDYLNVVADYKDIKKAVELDKISFPEDIKITEDLINKYTELVKDVDFLKHAAKVSKITIDKECNVNCTLDKYLETVEDYKEIVKIYKNCKELKQQYDTISEQLEEYQSKLNSYTVCPLCGHELNGEPEDVE